MVAIVLLILAVCVVLVGLGFLVFGSKKGDNENEHNSSGNFSGNSSGKRTLGWSLLGVGTLSFVVLWIGFMLVTIDTGHVGIPATFGKVDTKEIPLGEGLQTKMPWQTVKEMSIRQVSLDRNKAQGTNMEVLAGDRVALNTDASFHWTLQPTAATWIYQKFGLEYWTGLQVPSSASSLRDVVGKIQDWGEVISKKQKAENDVTERFSEFVVKKMLSAGIPVEIANNAFVFPKMDIRRTTPPKTILTAIANKKAATEDLERQDVEIQIEAKKAEKGAQEGLRVRNMLLAIFNPLKFDVDSKEFKLDPKAELPVNFDPANIPGIIGAIAIKQNAQSIQSAVENEGVNTILLPAGTPIAAAVN